MIAPSRLQRIRERGRESVSVVYGMSEGYSALGARRRASSCRMHAGFKLKEEIQSESEDEIEKYE